MHDPGGFRWLALVLVASLALAFPVFGVDLTDKLVSHLNFDNQSAWDSTGLYTVTNTGGVYISTGALGGSGYSWFTNDLGDNLIYDKQNAASKPYLTISSWINVTGWDTSNYGMLVSNRGAGTASIEIFPNNANVIQAELKTAGGTCSAGSVPYPNRKWIMITVTYNTSAGMRFYVNGSLISTDTSSCSGNINTATTFLTIARGRTDITNEDLLVAVDRFSVWNTTLNPTQVADLYAALGDPYPASGPPALTYSVTVTLANKSKSVKTMFSEGENLRARANFTRSDGLIMTAKNCSVLFYNNSIESANHTDRVICTGGSCASATILQHYNRTNTNLMYDSVHFDACHTAGVSGTLTVRLCGAAALTVQASQFPACPSTSFLFLQGSGCISKGYVSVNVSTTASFAQRINVSSLERDAFYKYVNLSMKYNATAALWQSPFVEYYQHQSTKASVSCSNASSKATADKSFTVVNVKPSVSIAGFDLPGGGFASVPGQVEYTDGIWSLRYVVSDDDTDWVRVQLRNSTGYIKVNSTKGPLSFTFNSTIIVDSGVYNISVWANDSFKNSTYVSKLFTLNDTAAPVCSGLGDREVWNGSVWALKVDCSDEYFFSLNVSCGTDWKFYREAIGAQKYNYTNNTFNITKNKVCLFEYCDGHTDSVVALDAGVTKDSISVGKVRLEAVTAMSSITFTKSRDKVSFCASPVDTKASYVQFKVPAGCYEAKGSPYVGHLVCPATRQWVDFSGASSVSISGGVVTAYMTKPGTACFDSIGAFNCVSGNFTVTAKHVPEGLFKTSNANAIWLLLGLLFFSLCFLGLSFRLPDIYGFVGPFLWLLTAFVAMAVYTWLAVVLFAVAIIDLFVRVARVSM